MKLEDLVMLFFVCVLALLAWAVSGCSATAVNDRECLLRADAISEGAPRLVTQEEARGWCREGR